MAKAKVVKPQVALTYQGDMDSIDYAGYHLPKGTAVEVDEELAKRFIDNPSFDVEGVTADDSTSSVSTEDALATERSAHQAEIDALKADFAKQLTYQADSLKAGWVEQHNADQAEITSLQAQLAAAQAPTPAAASDAKTADVTKAAATPPAA